MLDASHWRLLRLLGAANFFEGYDFFAVTVALPQIRQTFHLSQSQASLWLSVLYLGAIPAMFLSRRADVEGRRRLLIISISGYTVATAATALAPSIQAFVALQFFARIFLITEVGVAWTMIAEALPAGARGFGFGWLAMLSALGSGWASILYGTLFSPAGISWRWLYVAAVPPLVLIAFFRRNLPESARFATARDEGKLAARWREILEAPHRRNLILICVTAALGALSTQAGTFLIDFMQTDRHQSVRGSNLVLVGAGALAIPVLVIAGSLSDRLGRKVIGGSFSVVALGGLFLFFFAAHGAALLFLTLALLFIGDFGRWPTLGAFSSELFPTHLRALGGSWNSFFRVVGQASSFVLGSFLIPLTGSLSRAVAWLAIGPALAIVIIVVFFPETKGRELEDIVGQPVIPTV